MRGSPGGCDAAARAVGTVVGTVVAILGMVSVSRVIARVLVGLGIGLVGIAGAALRAGIERFERVSRNHGAEQRPQTEAEGQSPGEAAPVGERTHPSPEYPWGTRPEQVRRRSVTERGSVRESGAAQCSCRWCASGT